MADDPVVQQPAPTPPPSGPPPQSMDSMVDPDKGTKDALISLQKAKGGAEAGIAGQEAKSLTEDKARAQRAYDAEGVTIDEIGKQSWNADQELQKREHSPMENFGSLGSIIAIAASAFTHTSAISAFNAAAAYNEAVKNNDKDAYDKAYEGFKENSQLMIKRAQLERERYDDALKMAGMDMNIAQAKARAAAASFADKKALILMDAGMFPEFMQAKESMFKATADIQQNMQAIDRGNAQMAWMRAHAWDEKANGGKGAWDTKKYWEALKDWDTLNSGKSPAERAAADAFIKWKTEDYPREHDGAAPSGDEVLKKAAEMQTAFYAGRYASSRGGAGGITPGNLPPGWTEERVDFEADMLNQVGPSALSGLGFGSAAIKQYITARAAERALASGATAGDVIAGRADVKAEAATLGKLRQQQAAVGQFEETALKNGDMLVELSKKADSTGKPVLERWIRAGRVAVEGDADVSNFNLQMQLFRTEVAKILTNPNLTGVLSDSSRHEVEMALGNASSTKMIKGALDTLKKDFKNRQDSVNNQIETVTDRIKKSGAFGKPLSGDNAPPEPVPVGDNTRDFPDGKKFTKDGWLWQKQGDQIIPIERQ